MAIERQHVKEQDKNERRHNFDPVESNLTEEQVKLEAQDVCIAKIQNAYKVVL